MSRRTIIMLLASVNLFLFTAMLLSFDWLPRALAQRAGTSGNFLMLTSRWDKDQDALVLVDLPERKMHVLVPERDRGGQLSHIAHRNLEQDFEAARNLGMDKGARGDKK